MKEKEVLLKAANTAAIDLISTNNGTLSTEGIKTRLIRIADDLRYVVENLEEQK